MVCQGGGAGVLFGGPWYGNSSNRCLVFGTQSIIHTYIYVITVNPILYFLSLQTGFGLEINESNSSEVFND